MRHPNLSYAVLDRSGEITSVSRGWIAFARSEGLRLARHGVGCNYLDYCPQSPTRGLAQQIRALLSGKLDLVSTLYPCHSPSQNHWFILIGLPNVTKSKIEGATLYHVDVTTLLQEDPQILDQLASDIDSAISARERDIVGSSLNKVISEHFSDQNSREAQGAMGPRWDVLTPKEKEVALLVAQGKTNAEIAESVGSKVNTVKRHVAAIMKALRLKTRTQIAVWCHSHRGRRKSPTKGRPAAKLF